MGGGGAERVTANLANHWAAAGWEITVVTLAPIGLDFYELHPAVTRIPWISPVIAATRFHAVWQNVRRVIALRRALRKSRPDVALGIMTPASVILALAAYGLSVRTIGSERVHPPKFPLSPFWEGLRRRVYGRLDGLAVLTSETAQWIEAHTKARRVTVIPNAAPWPCPLRNRGSARDTVCRGRAPAVARGWAPQEQKGFDCCWPRFANLRKNIPAWDLVILGEGPDARGSSRAQAKAGEWKDGSFCRVAWVTSGNGTSKPIFT